MKYVHMYLITNSVRMYGLRREEGKLSHLTLGEMDGFWRDKGEIPHHHGEIKVKYITKR